MASWSEITRTKARHGHFAGASQAEEDTYFAFFSPEPTRIQNLWRATWTTLKRAGQATGRGASRYTSLVMHRVRPS